MDYKKAFEKYVNYQQDLHEKNQHRIEVGLKINILLPLIFLFLSFWTEGSKLTFLILWIVSLFGIASYLIYVEYTDYELQKQLKDFSGEEFTENDVLIGERVEIAEATVAQTMDKIDEKIEEQKQLIDEKREERKQMVDEKLEEGKQKVKETIEKLKEDEDA